MKNGIITMNRRGRMNYLECMNQAMNYIEQHLTEEIDFERLARFVGSSNVNFQRLFSFITNVSLSEYIRRRKLTLAAYDLQNTSLKIIEIALKYGYDSHEAFTRAFVKMHGVPPSSARTKGIQVKAYPKMKFHISIEGDEEVNYRIEKKNSFKMVGVEKIISMLNEENFKEIPSFWQECFQNGTVENLDELGKNAPHPGSKGLLPVNAIMCYRETGKDSFPYLIGTFMPEKDIPEGYTVAEVPEYLWAIFTTEKYLQVNTTSVVQEVWKRIYSEWFPSTNYEHAEGPELELYYEDEGGLEHCEIWIPLKENKDL
jgi:AraC family transcriptional regulator